MMILLYVFTMMLILNISNGATTVDPLAGRTSATAPGATTVSPPIAADRIPSRQPVPEPYIPVLVNRGLAETFDVAPDVLGIAAAQNTISANFVDTSAELTLSNSAVENKTAANILSTTNKPKPDNAVVENTAPANIVVTTNKPKPDNDVVENTTPANIVVTTNKPKPDNAVVENTTPANIVDTTNKPILDNSVVDNTTPANIVVTTNKPKPDNAVVENTTPANIVDTTNKPILNNAVVDNTTPANIVVTTEKTILDTAVVENKTPANIVVTTSMPTLGNSAIGFDPLLAPVTKMQTKSVVGKPIERTLPQSTAKNTVLQGTGPTYKISNNPVPISSDVTIGSLPVSPTTAPEQTTQGQDQQTTKTIQMTQGTNGQEAVAAHRSSVTTDRPSFETTTLVAKETTEMFQTSTVQATQEKNGTNILRSVVEKSQGASEQNLYRTSTPTPDGAVYPSSTRTTTQNVQATNVQNLLETTSHYTRETTGQNLSAASTIHQGQAIPEQNHGTTAGNIEVITSKSTLGKAAVEYTTLAKYEVTTDLPTLRNVAVKLASTVNRVKTTKLPELVYEYTTSSDIVGSTTISQTPEGSSVTPSSNMGISKEPITFDPLLAPLTQTQNDLVVVKTNESSLPQSKAKNTVLQETGPTYNIANNPVPTSNDVTTSSLPYSQTTAPEQTAYGKAEQMSTTTQTTQGANGQELLGAVAAKGTIVTTGQNSVGMTTLMATGTTETIPISTIPTIQARNGTHFQKLQGTSGQNLYGTSTSTPDGAVYPSSTRTTTQNVQATNVQNLLETTSHYTRETTGKNLPAASTIQQGQATTTTAGNIEVITSKSTLGKAAVEYTTLAKYEVTTDLPTLRNVAVKLASKVNRVKTTKLPELVHEYTTSSDIVGNTTISQTPEGSSFTPSSNMGTSKEPISFGPLLAPLTQTQNDLVVVKTNESSLPQAKAKNTVLQETGPTYNIANNPVPTSNDVTTSSLPYSQTTAPEQTAYGKAEQMSTTTQTTQGANGQELPGAVAAQGTIVTRGQNSVGTTILMATGTTETIPISTFPTLQARNGTNLQKLQGTTGQNLYGTTPTPHGVVDASGTGKTNQNVQATNVHHLLEKNFQNLLVASTVKQVHVTPEQKTGTTLSSIVITTNKPTLDNAAVEYTTSDKSWVTTSMPIFGNVAIDHVSSTRNDLMITKLPVLALKYTTSSRNGESTTFSPDGSFVSQSSNMFTTQGTAKEPIGFDPLLAPLTGTQTKSGVGKPNKTTFPQPKTKNTVQQGTDTPYKISKNPVPTSNDATASFLPVSQTTSQVVTKGTTGLIPTSTVQTIQAQKETDLLQSGVQNSQGTTGQNLNSTTTQTPFGAVDASRTGTTSRNGQVTNVQHLEKHSQISRGATGQDVPAVSTTQKVQATPEQNLGTTTPMPQGILDVNIRGRTQTTQTTSIRHQQGTASHIAQGTTTQNLPDATTAKVLPATLDHNIEKITPLAQGTTDGNILGRATSQNVQVANGHIPGAPSRMTEGTSSQNLSEASITQTMQVTTELSPGTTTLAPQGAVDVTSTGTALINAQTTNLHHLGTSSSKLQETTNVQNLPKATAKITLATKQNIITTTPMTKGTTELPLGSKTAPSAKGTVISNPLGTSLSQNVQRTTQGGTFGTNQIVQGTTDANVLGIMTDQIAQKTNQMAPNTADITTMSQNFQGTTYNKIQLPVTTDANILGAKTLKNVQSTTQVNSSMTSRSTGPITTEPTPLLRPVKGGTSVTAASTSTPPETALKAKFGLVSLTEMMKNLAKESTIASPCDNYICSTVAPHCVLVQQTCNTSQCPVGPECSDNAPIKGWCNSGHLVLDELFQQISCNPTRQDSCPQHSVCDGSKEVHKCCWIGTRGEPAPNTPAAPQASQNANGSSQNIGSRSPLPQVSGSANTIAENSKGQNKPNSSLNRSQGNTAPTDKTTSIVIGSAKQQPTSSFGVKTVDLQPNTKTLNAVDQPSLKAVSSVDLTQTQLKPGNIVTGQLTSINTNPVDKPIPTRVSSINQHQSAQVNHVSNSHMKPIDTNIAVELNPHVPTDPLTPTKETITVQSMPKNTNVAPPRGNAANVQGMPNNTNPAGQSPLVDASLPAQLKSTADQREFRITNLPQNENILSGNTGLLQTSQSNQGNFSPSRSNTVQNLSMSDKSVQSKPDPSSQPTTPGTNKHLTNFNKASSKIQTDATNGTANVSSSLNTNIGATSANAEKQIPEPSQMGRQIPSAATTRINENVKTSRMTSNEFSVKPNLPGAVPDFSLSGLKSEFHKTDQRLASNTFRQKDNITPSVSISSPGQERVYRAPTPYTATGSIENPIPLNFESQGRQIGTYRPGDIIIDIPTAGTNTNHATISGVTKTGVVHLGTHPIGHSPAASRHTPLDTQARQSAGPDMVRSYNSHNQKNILSAEGVSMSNNIQRLPAETTKQLNQNAPLLSTSTVSRPSIKSAMPLYGNTLTDNTNVPLLSTFGNFQPSQNEPPMVGKTNIHAQVITPPLRNANIQDPAISQTMHTDGIVPMGPVISHTNPVNANGQITAAAIPQSRYMQGDRTGVSLGGNIQHQPAGSSINHDAGTFVSGHNQGSQATATTLPLGTQKGPASSSSLPRSNHIKQDPKPVPRLTTDPYIKGRRATGSRLPSVGYKQGGHVSVSHKQGNRQIQGVKTSEQGYPTKASSIQTIHSTTSKTGHIQRSQKHNPVLSPSQNNLGNIMSSTLPVDPYINPGLTLDSAMPNVQPRPKIGQTLPNPQNVNRGLAVGSSMKAVASNYKSQIFPSKLSGNANVRMMGSSVPRSASMQTGPTVGSEMARDSVISGRTYGAPMTELSNSRTAVPATSGLQRNTLSKQGPTEASKPKRPFVKNTKTKLDAQPYKPLSQPKQNIKHSSTEKQHPTSLKTVHRRTRIQTMVHVKPHGNGHNITKTIKITSPRSNKRNLPITVKSNVFRQTPVTYQDHMGQRRKAPAYGVAISTTVGKHVTKPGFCYKPCGLDICANDCIHDGQCPGLKKCCNTGCGHVCTDPFPVLPITKQGTCPVPIKIKSCPNVRKCKHDGQCPGSSKCCCISAGCRVCVPQKNLLSSQPITHSKRTTVSTSGNKTDVTTHISSTIITKNRPVGHKPGFCHLPCGPFQCTQECSNDRQCPGESKCCNTGCGRVCSSPLPRIPRTKPGHCPAHNPSRACPRVTQCRHDYECPGSAKCCCIGPSCRVCVTQGSPLYLMSGSIPNPPFLK